jgi:diguanylate cyclase (GGDEF)-like protein
VDIATKVLSWGAGGALAGGLSLLAFQSLLMLPYWDRLETRAAEAKADQVQSLFEADAEAFSLTAEDWSYWDESASFTSGRNPGFEDENLYPTAFESIRVDAMAFFRPDGSLFWARRLSTDHRELVAFETAPYRKMLDRLGPRRTASGAQGYLRTADGLVLVSLRQIRPSSEAGEPQGTLLMVRNLGPGFWLSLQKRAGLAFFPAEPGSDLSLARGPVIARSEDRSMTTLRIPMPDITGELSLELTTTLARTLTQTGFGLLVQVAWGSVAILVLTSLANMLLIRVFLVRPVKELWRLAREVGATGDWSLRAVPRSRDEIGELARGMNGLIQSVEDTTMRLKELASTDPLTGLANRRTFDQAFEVAWRACQRDQQPLSVIIGDVDRFKQYNDLHGHQGGDGCLKMVAQVFRDAAARPTDIRARYGGEEFAVVLPQTDLKGARTVAERIRKAVGALGAVTISLGCSSVVPSPQETAADLLARADHSLYDAKADGRNCVRG